MPKKPPIDLAAAMEADLQADDRVVSLNHERKRASDHENMDPGAYKPERSLPPDLVRAAGISAPTPIAPSRVGMKRIQGYFSPRVKRQLRRLAADLDLSEEALVGQALNLLFAAKQLPAIAFDGKDRPESEGG